MGKFKVDDEVIDIQSGCRGRIVRVSDNRIIRSYDVRFHVADLCGVRMESNLELASAVDRLSEIVDE